MRRLAVLGCLLVLAGCGGTPDTAGPRSTPAPVPAPDTAAETPGDLPPHHSDNRGWRHRDDISAADRPVAERAAARLRTALAEPKAAGRFDETAVRGAIEDAGFAADAVTVRATEPALAAFGVRVADTACVVGDVGRDRLRAAPAGVAAEFGCLEPRSH